MFGFIAYQLWGTGIEYARAQDELKVQLETPTVAPPEPGDALLRLEVPAIGLDTTVVEGVGREQLERGPGHYPSTPRPGQLGNAAVAGHRTTYGAPFQQLDELVAGDDIILTGTEGRFVYRMTDRQVVDPSASAVLATTDPTVFRLTLTTCHPEYSAESRLIVSAELDESASTPVNPPAGPGASPPVTESSASADAFAQGWFTDTDAFGPLAWWGFALALIGFGAHSLSRVTGRHAVGALAGIAPFVVASYFFFQNVNRLLPAAL